MLTKMDIEFDGGWAPQVDGDLSRNGGRCAMACSQNDARHLQCYGA
jgi:hypothetical protein